MVDSRIIPVKGHRVTSFTYYPGEELALGEAEWGHRVTSYPGEGTPGYIGFYDPK